MADVHSKETRSYNMSCIRSKDTKPELLVRKFLHKNGVPLMPNIKPNYLYRDSGNYRKYRSTIFANPNNIDLLELEALIKES
jgi:DNA mismatch endonuclease (patch repair protein)